MRDNGHDLMTMYFIDLQYAFSHKSLQWGGNNCHVFKGEEIKHCE